ELPAALRRDLEVAFPLRRLTLTARQVSADGTEKYLWDLGDGEAVESVLIPEGKRRTLCISSQVGCALGCVFCATGRMGFRRNLSVVEIACQVREVMLLDAALKPTNVVFMGMGEPLLNWDAVDRALTILNHADALGIGARHITVSTVGILPNLAKLAQRPEQFRLALSLHAPTPELRHELMPIEKKYTLPAVRRTSRRAPGRRCSRSSDGFGGRGWRRCCVAAAGSISAPHAGSYGWNSRRGAKSAPRSTLASSSRALSSRTTTRPRPNAR